ncbi:MAG: hypothetical protein LBP59_14855 [Planctomycetaceae bacterium]|jgi:T5SS/PEP-CTERM-associated repeat protein|nr:hypothetical protein [Planctomycetaceae bacterium]
MLQKLIQKSDTFNESSPQEKRFILRRSLNVNSGSPIKEPDKLNRSYSNRSYLTRSYLKCSDLKFRLFHPVNLSGYKFSRFCVGGKLDTNFMNKNSNRYRLAFFVRKIIICAIIFFAITYSFSNCVSLFAQQTIHVNEQQYQSQYYNGGVSGGSWGSWSGWSSGSGGYYTGSDYGSNYFSNIAGLISAVGTNSSTGGIVELCTDVKGNYTHVPGSYYNSGYSYNYRSGWNYGSSHTSGGGDMNVNSGHTVTLLNKLSNAGTSSAPLTITTMNKNGAGNLILDYAASGSAFHLNTSTFRGNGGGFQVGGANSVQYNSTTTIAGSTAGFNATVTGGSTWTAGNLTAQNIFNINGGGIMTATNTSISGTTTSNIATLITGALSVGVTAGDGNLIVNSGNVTTTTANIANDNHNGTVQLNGAGVTWTTSNIANVGNTGSDKVGVVDILNGVWNANNQVNIANVAGGDGIVNIHSGSVLNATNQTVNVGLNGTGYVNQSGGTWTNNNTFVAVNNNSQGYIEQSGGVHTDLNVVVGVSGKGVANVHGVGTQWITNDNNNAANNAAVIAQNNNSNGKVAIYDNATWNIGATGNADNLIAAAAGIGELDIYSNAKVNVAGEHIIAEQSTAYGTDKIYSGGELNIAGNLTTAANGKAQLKVYAKGIVNVSGNHIVANAAASYGSDQIDGDGSGVNIAGDMTVAESGLAGGRYVYYPEGTRDQNYAALFNNGGKTNTGDNSLGGGFYKDPIEWLGSPNLELRLGDADWSSYSEDAPGLAITAGGVVNVSGAGGVKVSNQSGSYAYILLDNKNATTGRSTWNIDNDLIMGVTNRTNDNLDDAYMRITNGSLVAVGGQVVIANGAGTDVTARINGSQGANNATLDVAKNLIVAKGASGVDDVVEGNLYVYDKGRVDVGKINGANMTIADTSNTLGRVQVDGAGSTIVVNGLLTVANAGYAGAKYKYDNDNNPNNDNNADPSFNGKWFDAPSTLSDLKTAGGVNDNAPGMLITRGGVVESRSGNVATVAGSYAYSVIDGKDANPLETKWTITDEGLTIADKGEAYMRVFNGGLIETKNTTNGNIIIANDGGSIATVRIFNKGSKIDAANDLIVSRMTNSDGQLYIYDGAAGNVGGNMIVAEAPDANAQVQIDGAGSKLNVARRLTVGYFGAAGNYYNENRYEPAKETNPNIADKGYRNDPQQLNTPPSKWWFDSPNMNLRNNKNYAGNAPGLAITDGGFVESGSGVIGARSRDGDALDGVGYVVIDNHYGFNGATGRQGTRSTWHVKETTGGTDDQNGDLIIGREGKGFIRVLNGGLLEVDGHTKLNSRINNSDTSGYDYAGIGSLYVFGNGGNIRAIPHAATATNIPSYVTPYEDGNRSTWISHKATILGDTGNVTQGGDAIIRINNGAYGETHGIYAGYSEGSRGDVSVMGKASELHIYKDEQIGTAGYNYEIDEVKGSGGLSVSNHALLQLHKEGNITLNGMSIISHNSLLHLDVDSILDSRDYSAKIVNARVEGVGTITAENGVTFLYDSMYSESITDPVYTFGNGVNDKIASVVTKPTSAQIDPGLYYGWNVKNEYYQRYGKLTFGDRLTLAGNVNTFFDVNSGWRVPGDSSAPGDTVHQLNDTIAVKRGDSSTSAADILATLAGTLKIHARLTKYFLDEPSFKVVQTEGDNKSGQFVPGRITRTFDRLEIVPWRFFENPHQEIRRDENGNDALWVSMKLKKNPFEESGKTYNEKSTGNALDDIYNTRNERWLPVLRYFWYLESPEFLEAYRTFSGEIKAHSLLLPLQNVWTYNQNRIGFRQCRNKSHRHGYDKIDLIDPCKMTEMANNVKGCDSFSDRLIKRWNKYKKNMRFWGDYIHEQADYDSDGNAGAFNLNRNGIVVGFDKPDANENQYLGLQFAIVKGELDAFLSEANVDDFNIGIYHGKKIHNVFEWRNFLGMGIERYKINRSLNGGLAYYEWVWDTPDGAPSNNPADGHYHYNDETFNDTLRSSFSGYGFYANTEIARPFILGTCNQYMIRPFAALDITSVWQNATTENGEFRGANFVKLEFMKANYFNIWGRPGIIFERNGDKWNLHAGLAYQFKLGGRPYANVNNKFNVGSKNFNIRSVDTGSNFLNLNCGVEYYIGKKKNQFVMINYQTQIGKNSTAQAVQLGYQYKF